jgi:hypothetical protein
MQNKPSKKGSVTKLSYGRIFDVRPITAVLPIIILALVRPLVIGFCFWALLPSRRAPFPRHRLMLRAVHSGLPVVRVGRRTSSCGSSKPISAGLDKG